MIARSIHLCAILWTQTFVESNQKFAIASCFSYQRIVEVDHGSFNPLVFNIYIPLQRNGTTGFNSLQQTGLGPGWQMSAVLCHHNGHGLATMASVIFSSKIIDLLHPCLPIKPELYPSIFCTYYIADLFVSGSCEVVYFWQLSTHSLI